MKKFSILKSTMLLGLVVSTSLMVFSGCSSKKAEDTTATKTATESSTSKEATSTKDTSTNSDRKTKIQEMLKSLVSAGTINETQSTKILEALTANNKGAAPSGQPSGDKSTTSADSKKPADANSTPPADAPDPSKSGDAGNKGANPLAQLVTDKVISQEQADAVMTKMKDITPAKGDQTSQKKSTDTSTSKSDTSSTTTKSN